MKKLFGKSISLQQVLKVFSRWSLVFGLMFSLCACISLKAGTYYQGAEDPAPKKKEIGLDTRDLIPGQAPGSIEIAD